MLVIKTKAAWQLGLRRRSESLTPNDRITVVDQQNIMNWLMSKRKKLLYEEDTASNIDSIHSLSQQIYGIQCNILNYLTVERTILSNEHKRRTISSFSDDWIYSNTRFHSSTDLMRLYKGLRIPDKIILDNKSVVSGEEALLVTLYRLSFPRRLSDFEKTFGREYSHWSRVIKYTLEWIVRNWWYLMSNSIEYWKDHIPSFHRAIVTKIIELGYAASVDLLGVDSEEMTYGVFGFIDNTIIRTCRPGGGAAARGPNND